MLCAFFGAGIGNYLRCKLTKHHFTLFLCIAASVSSACLVYAGLLKIAELLWGISIQHEAGYICAMLFIIPGFPFITSGIDLAKLDMRSGLERLAYALIIIAVATMFAWMVALLLHLQPVDFLPLNLTLTEKIIFRLLASFCGVFGFSIMFNSPRQLAADRSRDRRHCKYIPVRTCGSSRNTFRGRCIFRCTDRWTARIPFKKPCRLSKDCDHRSIYRYHGSRIIPVPCDL